MTRSIVIAPKARDDLGEIWRYIAADSIDSADRVLTEFERVIDQLAEIPGMGHQRRDVRDQRLRFWKVYSYLIAYTHTEHELSIARVVSGHRNLRRVLK